MLIDAPPAVVFEMMTRCADALQYVPHLRVCRVTRARRPISPGSSWSTRSTSAGTRPASDYVFRADLVRDRSITFRQVSGDFKANDGIWEFEPVEGGVRTLLRYRVYMDPPGFIPNWLARSTFKRELPQMLAGSAPTL